MRKALGLGGPEAVDPRGKLLAASTKTFKALRDQVVYQMLCAFEPARFDVAALEASELTKNDMATWVTFALGVSPSARLPSISPDLRYEASLIAYCIARYHKLGRRLQNVELDKPDSVGDFAWGEATKTVTLRVPLLGDVGAPPSAVLNQITAAGGWETRSNFSYEATLVPENEAVEVELIKRFRAAGFGILSETDAWASPSGRGQMAYRAPRGRATPPRPPMRPCLRCHRAAAACPFQLEKVKRRSSQDQFRRIWMRNRALSS